MTRRPHEPTTDQASHTHVPYLMATDRHPAYTQLAVDDKLPKPSISREDPDDDEIDELAGTSLVNVPTQTFNLPSTKRDSLLPTRTSAERTDESHPANGKPLPSLPSNPPPQGTESSKTKTQVLGPKSTNQKVISKMAKFPPKPNISPPVLISSSIDPFAGTVAAGGLADPSLNELDRKVSSLTRRADAHEAETRARENLLAVAEASFKPSPLQRGRSVLMTAKHAIARRLGSPNIKLGRFKTPLSRKSSGTTSTLVNETFEPVNAVPRPLPVYESMRSRRETPEPLDNDPFSDKMEMDEAWSDFEFNFDRHKDQSVGARDESSSRTSSVNGTDEPASEALLAQSKSIMSFSNKVSGLKQHPNPELFSSSPVGFSTPRVRLEPTADANGKKRLSTVLVRDPLLHDISSERDTTDDEDHPLVHNKLNAVYGSSMKRKSATEDLHSQMSKRAKTDSAASGGTAVLTQGFDQLGTNDVQSMQGIERIAEDMASVEDPSHGKGFGIFDMSKGKQTETRFRDSVESLDLRRHSRRYSSSISRPTSVLFSRETRAKVPLLDSYKEDQMDIDELQMDDPLGRR
ncbi:MAG: hypothetical protein L6R42_009664 [Xanthoria sp. 1 TBL-2021]|nr:MAG: hypothetical protein L6R42_009664 [Xanthoria sp. 1 TBL-2021]